MHATGIPSRFEAQRLQPREVLPLHPHGVVVLFRAVLEVKAQFASDGTGAYKVRPAEGGEEIVKCFLVGEVNDGHACTPSEAIAVKQIVVAHRDVKQVAWRDARRIEIVVLRAIGWNLDAYGAGSGRIGSAARGVIAEGRRERRHDPLAAWTRTEQPDRRLLVAVE